MRATERPQSSSIRAVVVATTRTGSGWLVSLLDSHPDIRFQDELFNLERLTVRAVRDPAAYLAERLADDGIHRVTGFKMLYHHARLAYMNDFLGELDEGRESEVDWREGFPVRPVRLEHCPTLETAWEAIRDRGRTRIIHLKRRDLFRRYLSHEILMAKSRARWRGEAPAAEPDVCLDPDRVLAILQGTRREQEEVDGFFRLSPKIEVFYEDLDSDLEGECERIQGFLGVDPRSLSSSSRRSPESEPRELTRCWERRDFY